MQDLRREKAESSDAKQVNYGVYYTPRECASILWDLLSPHLREGDVLLDPACGAGDLLAFKPPVPVRKVGVDIDPEAVEMARGRVPDAEFRVMNSLGHVSREAFGIQRGERLVVITNPPYNDFTSLAGYKTKGKRNPVEVHPVLATRDLGLSFFRLFYYLRASVVVAVHPLSYLIKPANFALMEKFAGVYRLERSVIVPSTVFSGTSRTSPFPILLAVYVRERGMDWDYVAEYEFRTVEGKVFRVKDWDYIGRYIPKNGEKKAVVSETGLYFWPLRDINALRRNRTFVPGPGPGLIPVSRRHLEYYIYIDVVKDFIDLFPYYLGNLDIPWDYWLWQEYRAHFLAYALAKRPELKDFVELPYEAGSDSVHRGILDYFRELLGSHYPGGQEGGNFCLRLPFPPPEDVLKQEDSDVGPLFG